MAKTMTQYVCQECGRTSPKFMGRCPGCGEWNTLEIICDGDTITNIVNGVVANRAYNVKPTKGKIQIQSEYAGLEFRRVTILPLEK